MAFDPQQKGAELGSVFKKYSTSILLGAAVGLFTADCGG